MRTSTSPPSRPESDSPLVRASLLARARGYLLSWNGAKLFLALVVIPLWVWRFRWPLWIYGSWDAYNVSGADIWFEWLNADWFREADFYVLLAQIWLLVTALSSLWNSPHWRTALFCGASLWLWWGTNDFWNGRILMGSNATTTGERGLFVFSTLWFSFYSSLIAWLWWDDERLTVRLIVGTVVSTILFRFWIFAGLGGFFSAWIVVIFVHFAFIALGAGAGRVLAWRWQGPLTSGTSPKTASSGQVNERQQFRFVHLLLAIACAAVLVVGLRPNTQLHQDLNELFRGWQGGPPCDIWLVILVPLVSAAIGLCSVAAIFSRHWWWPLLAAIVLSIAAITLVPALDRLLSVAVQEPFLAYSAVGGWPQMSWDWVQWTGHLIVAPWALLGAHRTAGYRWTGTRPAPNSTSSPALPPAGRRP